MAGRVNLVKTYWGDSVRRVLASAVLAAAVVASAGCAASPPAESAKVTEYYEANKTLKPISAEKKQAVTVALVSDSHAHNAKSWWRETVGSGKVPGAKAGDVQSFPGGDSESIAERLKAVDYAGGFIVVQAGTNDLRAGDDAAATAEGVRALVAQVRERKGVPVLALIPPSNDAPDVAKEANDILSAWADDEKIPVVDVYTAVANENGSWQDGMSDDNIHANPAGSAKMAAAAQAQLAAILKG